ncbi:hypothetical protein MGG_04936 [Pyricularia oryzae 70-15]|uniref:Pyrroloquinoline quinone-dependent pyranose dehydrogenase beta-propeller domain-containing protein n=3 Tax=Pyricularia oryzae TaxID=318829 RepID=G4N365_PYRO7|nr:uncharacterized protein MGG_04936 [Pyricularia oryzae 70-15]EHA52621.1 hypothetical protein MGG_04936 [Pyricularia oryzae 70-15]ELQ44657.1 hypothetical protein OOU_Y34scaffold00071g73 [Pyricularia oryzae Y34]KAI7930367.1 hypothetical protein M9X92_000804 [Pyricularia oryzae]KAI7932131.1 hypothetical protein M0657_000856 [Pyricularia oryzae]
MHSVISSAALVWLLVAEAAAQNCAAVTSRFQPKMGPGYQVRVIATGLRSPRHIRIDSAGNLLVAEGGTATVRRLVLKEQGGSVCVSSNTALTPVQSTNHGIDLSADGKTLYTSSLASVTAFPYDAAAGTVGAGKAIITGMSIQGTHPTRAILVSKMNPDVLLVARGSQANVDTQTTSQTAGRSMIKTFSLKQITAAPVQYTAGGEVLGWGLRNVVGMAEDPVSGNVFSVENQMDDIRLGGRDVHNENPAERLAFHGNLNDTSNAQKGLNFGYPSCVPAWDTQQLGNNLQVGDLFMPDGVPQASDCARRAKGRLHFPAHTAPLDMAFNANATSAYIAFHGSWNRNPADGYRVMRVDFDPATGQPKESATSKTASIPVMENTNVGACPGACFRPVGLAFDAKGRLYVSSDSSGEIYVITGA